jgi:hypothetical protein
MSQKTSEFEPIIRWLERQAAELMHEDTDLLTVITEFALTDTPVSGTTAKEWEAKYGCRPMVCAFDCKELAVFTTTGLSEYLVDAERACARTLGFDPGQFASDKTAPGRTTLDRTWRNRFPDRLKSFITQSAQGVLAVAHDMGNPLGMRALEPTDKTDCSNRTERRYVTEKIKDVTDALCQIVFPAIDLDRDCPHEGTQYVMTSTRFENWLRIRRVEACSCLFTDPMELVNRDLYAFPQIHCIDACINLFYTLLVEK